jgi:O-antigen ligase
MVLVAFGLMSGRRLKLGVIVALALAVGTLWVASSDSTLSRLRQFDTSGTGRVDLWTVALRMWEDHPVNGVGYRNFPVESSHYLLQPGSVNGQFVVNQPKETHNAYLGILAETGVVGLALFLSAVVLFIRATWQGAQALQKVGDERFAALGRAVVIAQIGSLAALMFAHNPQNQPFWILLALGPVLITIAQRTPSTGPSIAAPGRRPGFESAPRQIAAG